MIFGNNASATAFLPVQRLKRYFSFAFINRQQKELISGEVKCTVTVDDAAGDKRVEREFVDVAKYLLTHNREHMVLMNKWEALTALREEARRMQLNFGAELKRFRRREFQKLLAGLNDDTLAQELRDLLHALEVER